MTIPDLLRALRASTHVLSLRAGRGEWRALGAEVWQGRKVIGKMQDRELAEHVCLVHNAAVPMFNAVLRSWNLVKDLRKLLQEVP
jgi:hypothetical protein